MKRRFDWRSRLHAEIMDWESRSGDCLQFIDACLHAMVDESTDLGHLSTEAAVNALTSRFQSVAQAHAHEGDIVIISDHEGSDVLGILLGERAATMGPNGYLTYPRRLVQQAFTVP